ncbi:biopolymer transporter Tol [Spirulina sp. 06S082]|nr:biopolymer transporter Tol [Spirulina sp. 06S082]MEA5467925.1 biopolymer transporter Tol [Spirulina sp. 06S082]
MMKTGKKIAKKAIALITKRGFFGLFLAIGLLGGCGDSTPQLGSVSLNSRYNDQEPALSGDGKLLALVTNRNGISQIAVYSLQQKRFLDLPGLTRNGQIAESPSLSRTGRYLVYLVSDRGRPAIAFYDRAIAKADILTTSYRNWIRNPKISPDGRYVVFETSRRGQWDIEVLDRGPDIELDVIDGTPLF